MRQSRCRCAFCRRASRVRCGDDDRTCSGGSVCVHQAQVELLEGFVLGGDFVKGHALSDQMANDSIGANAVAERDESAIALAGNELSLARSEERRSGKE